MKKLPPRIGIVKGFRKSLAEMESFCQLKLGHPALRLFPSEYFEDTWYIKNEQSNRVYKSYQVRKISVRYNLEFIKEPDRRIKPREWYWLQASFNASPESKEPDPDDLPPV